MIKVSARSNKNKNKRTAYARHRDTLLTIVRSPKQPLASETEEHFNPFMSSATSQRQPQDGHTFARVIQVCVENSVTTFQASA